MDFPNLFIVGAAKAGTTSLHRYLNAHPEIEMSSFKEPHFFLSEDKLDVTTTTSIRKLADYFSLFQSEPHSRYLGEASPSYLWDLSVPSRIYSHSPNAKIIIILRDPLTRAFSHYNMEVHAEREKHLSFIKAVKSDMVDTRSVWGQKNLYIELGLYADSIRRFRGQFGSQNVLVLFYEEFFQDLTCSMDRVSKFLEISPFSHLNKTYSTQYNKLEYATSLLKLLKRVPGRRFIPEGLKGRLKRFLVKKGELSNEEIEVLIPFFKKDLRQLHLDENLTFYTDWFLKKYQIDLLTD